jgi:hypothetical protein
MATRLQFRPFQGGILIVAYPDFRHITLPAFDPANANHAALVQRSKAAHAILNATGGAGSIEAEMQAIDQLTRTLLSTSTTPPVQTGIGSQGTKGCTWAKSTPSAMNQIAVLLR